MNEGVPPAKVRHREYRRHRLAVQRVRRRVRGGVAVALGRHDHLTFAVGEGDDPVQHRGRSSDSCALPTYQDDVPYDDIAGVQRAGQNQAAHRRRLFHAAAEDHQRAVPEEPWHGHQRQEQDNRHDQGSEQTRRAARPATATVSTASTASPASPAWVRPAMPSTAAPQLRGSGRSCVGTGHVLVVRSLLGVEGERRRAGRTREGVAGGQRQSHLEAQRLGGADG